MATTEFQKKIQKRRRRVRRLIEEGELNRVAIAKKLRISRRLLYKDITALIDQGKLPPDTVRTYGKTG